MFSREKTRPIKPWIKRVSKEESQLGMKVLIGVPVIRVSGLVQLCLQSLISTPASVLVIDNAADPDVKDVIRSCGDRVRTIVNGKNLYCNGAWNQIMEHGLNNDYDLIGLASSDVVLYPGWYEKIVQRALSFPNEVWLPNQGKPSSGTVVNPNIGWYFSFLPRKAVEMVYPIPYTLRHWFGDTHMAYVLKENGWSWVLLNDMGCDHQQSAITVRVPEAGDVIAQDKIAWKALRG
jgi:hypothetical protein